MNPHNIVNLTVAQIRTLADQTQGLEGGELVLVSQADSPGEIGVTQPIPRHGGTGHTWLDEYGQPIDPDDSRHPWNDSSRLWGEQI